MPDAEGFWTGRYCTICMDVTRENGTGQPKVLMLDQYGLPQSPACIRDIEVETGLIRIWVQT